MLDNEQQMDFSDLWTDAQPTVAAYVRGMVRDAHVATDIVQNTAIVLMKKFSAWDSSQAFLPWALGFAKFEILAHFRDTARRRVVFGEEMMDSITEMWPSMSAEIDLEESALHECLDSLAPKARELVRLRYFDDLEMTHVASRMDSTAGAIRVALMRIRRRLMDCVNRRIKTFGEET